MQMEWLMNATVPSILSSICTPASTDPRPSVSFWNVSEALAARWILKNGPARNLRIPCPRSSVRSSKVLFRWSPAFKGKDQKRYPAALPPCWCVQMLSTLRFLCVCTLKTQKKSKDSILTIGLGFHFLLCPLSTCVCVA